MISEEEAKLDEWDREEHRGKNHYIRNYRDEQGQEEWLDRKEKLISAKRNLIERKKEHLDDNEWGVTQEDKDENPSLFDDSIPQDIRDEYNADG